MKFLAFPDYHNKKNPTRSFLLPAENPGDSNTTEFLTTTTEYSVQREVKLKAEPLELEGCERMALQEANTRESELTFVKL